MLNRSQRFSHTRHTLHHHDRFEASLVEPRHRPRHSFRRPPRPRRPIPSRLAHQHRFDPLTDPSPSLHPPCTHPLRTAPLLTHTQTTILTLLRTIHCRKSTHLRSLTQRSTSRSFQHSRAGGTRTQSHTLSPANLRGTGPSRATRSTHRSPLTISTATRRLRHYILRMRREVQPHCPGALMLPATDHWKRK